jgi:hypothetical protein
MNQQFQPTIQEDPLDFVDLFFISPFQTKKKRMISQPTNKKKKTK